MSALSSQNGTEYDNGFAAGFLAQNHRIMLNGDFNHHDTEIYETCGGHSRLIGDIDLSCTITEDIMLSDLLSYEAKINTKNIKIVAGTQLFMELTTTSSQDALIARDHKPCKINKKIDFYNRIPHIMKPTDVFIFVHNGLENANNSDALLLARINHLPHQYEVAVVYFNKTHVAKWESDVGRLRAEAKIAEFQSRENDLLRVLEKSKRAEEDLARRLYDMEVKYRSSLRGQQALQDEDSSNLDSNV